MNLRRAAQSLFLSSTRAPRCLALVFLLTGSIPAAEHHAELSATADTVLLSRGWGEAGAQAFGDREELPLSSMAGQRVDVLTRFPIDTLRRASQLRVVRARLRLRIAAFEAGRAPERLEVVATAPLSWEERKLTSDAWRRAETSATLTREEVIGSVSLSNAQRGAWIMIPLRPGPIESILAGAAPNAEFLVRPESSSGEGMMSLSSREANDGEFAPRLLLWYEGDYLPTIDPDFRAWDSPDAHAFFADLRGVGDAPDVAVETAARDLRLRLFWRDHVRTPEQLGMVDAPCLPFAIRDTGLSFDLAGSDCRGEVNVSLLFSTPGGKRLVWRHALRDGDTASTSVVLTQNDMRLVESPFAEFNEPGAMTRPGVTFSFDASTTGAAATVSISSFVITTQDATGKRLERPALIAPKGSIATRRYPQSRPVHQRPPTTAPRVIVTLGEQRLATLGADLLAQRMARETSLVEFAFFNSWNARVAEAGEILAKHNVSMSFQASVSSMTAGEIMRGAAWSAPKDGASPNIQRALLGDSQRRGMASLALPETAEAIALLASGVADAGVLDFTLNDPAWPGDVERRRLAGYAPKEIEEYRRILSGDDTGVRVVWDNEPSRIYFGDYFDRRLGFEPEPHWFGYVSWAGYSPGDLPDTAQPSVIERRQRLLWDTLRRYIWLRFVGEAGRLGKASSPEERFMVCASTSRSGLSADAVAALDCESLDGVFARLDDSTASSPLDPFFHEWPQLSERAKRRGKRLGFVRDGDFGVRNNQSARRFDRLAPYALGYALRGAATADDLRQDASLPDFAAAPSVGGGRALDAAAGVRHGFSDAVLDKAWLMSDRDALVIADNATDANDSPFARSTMAARFAPLLGDLRVAYDLCRVSNAPSDFSRYRVIFLDATTLPDEALRQLTRWLDGDDDRRLVTAGATLTRCLSDDVFWSVESAWGNPQIAVNASRGAPLGLYGIRMEQREENVLMIGPRAPGFSARLRPGTMFNLASPLLYSVKPKGQSLATLSDGFPLISEIRRDTGGAVIYFHYNVGVSSSAQVVVDRQALASLIAYLKLATTARGDFGPSIQPLAVTLPGAIEAAAYLLSPRSDIAQRGENDDDKEDDDLRVWLPVDDSEPRVVYSLLTGVAKAPTAGPIGLAVTCSRSQTDMLYVCREEAATSMTALLGRRRADALLASRR